jgi:Holliday junction resolvase RusA-like endonuclease
MLKFLLPLDPPPSNQAALRILKTRDGRQFIGKTAKSSAKKWSNDATLLLKSYYKGAPIDKAVQVYIEFNYAHTIESAKVAKREGIERVPKATRPDLDNLAKLILDSIVQAGILKDDSLIVELAMSKVYTDKSYIVIGIDDYAAE